MCGYVCEGYVRWRLEGKVVLRKCVSWTSACEGLAGTAFFLTDVPIATLLALASNYPPANPTKVIYPELLGNDVSHKCTFHITYKGKLFFFFQFES